MPVLHRRVGVAAVGEPAAGVRQLEGAVERRHEARSAWSAGPPSARARASSRPALRCPGTATCRARVVDPGDAGDQSAGSPGSGRKLVISTGGREPPSREGRVPDALARERGVDHRPDLRRAVVVDRGTRIGLTVGARRRPACLGSALQRGAALGRSVQRVVEVLDVVDEPARAVVAQPLDGPDAEARVGGWSAPRRRDQRRAQAEHRRDRRDPAQRALARRRGRAPRRRARRAERACDGVRASNGAVVRSDIGRQPCHTGREALA